MPFMYRVISHVSAGIMFGQAQKLSSLMSVKFHVRQNFQAEPDTMHKLVGRKAGRSVQGQHKSGSGGSH
jgi:alpha-amylase/alpha-mannosidase (GH57 family)